MELLPTIFLQGKFVLNETVMPDKKKLHNYFLQPQKKAAACVLVVKL